jgi:hypothetical protein
MKVVTAAALAAVLSITSAGAALACHKPPPPPEPLAASITLCGDPRAIISITGEGTARIVFWSGATGERKVIRKDVDGARTLKRWVKGQRKVSVYDDATNEVLARVKVTRSAIVGPCPVVVA